MKVNEKHTLTKIENTFLNLMQATILLNEINFSLESTASQKLKYRLHNNTLTLATKSEHQKQ